MTGEDHIMDHMTQPPTDAVPDTDKRSAVVSLLAHDIKISHSIFALPFAILAAFAARDIETGWGRFAGQLALVVLCMVAARTAAMLANRILDRDIDLVNPRTQHRAVASGQVLVRQAVRVYLWSCAVFLVSCAVFGFVFDNWWPMMLSLPVLGWISIYPLLKRYTWLCHIYLGSSLAVSPLAAAIAVCPDSIILYPSLWCFAGFVLFWVGGFDIIYALQDELIDREQNIKSVPGRFGRRIAMWVSRFFHLAGITLLVFVPVLDVRFDHILFWTGGIGVVISLLLLEHIVIARGGNAKIQMAFLTLNGIISCILGTCGIVSVVLSR